MVWRNVKLGQICKFKYGEMPKKSDLADEGYPVFSGYRQVGTADRYHYRDPEIIVVARGLGGTGDVKMTPPFCFLTNLSIAILVEDAEVFKAFLYYTLSFKTLWELRTGSAQAQITIERLKDYELLLPSLPVQRRIASILSAYDELIENSQRRIKILETMARALYREWFVHFRFPGHENHPRVASPLGEIPEGWEVKRLGDVLELNYGKALKKEDRRDGPFPVFGSSGEVGTHDTGLVRGPGIIVGRKGNVGSVFWCDEDFFVIDTAYFVSSTLPLRFLYYVLPTLNFINSDAAVPGLSRSQAYSLEVLVPPMAIMQKFCNLAEAFEHKSSLLRHQVRNLRRTRDLLLPRLLSGQVSFSDLEADSFEEARTSDETPTIEAPARAARATSPLPKPTIATEPAPAIDDTERQDVLCTIRQVFNDGGPRDRDSAIRDIAHALGYQRTGSRIREVVSGDLATAVRRGIVTNDGGVYRLGYRSYAECTRESLKSDFESAIGRAWIEREDAIRAFARWGGFGRVGPVIEETARSLINGLIREGRLETDGPDRIRRV